jgi:HlyD family secretion protein
MSDVRPTKTKRSIRRHLVAGLTAVFVLVGGIGGWAATVELAGAIIAPGHLVVESEVKTIQHPTGGIVAELLVKNGDQVEAGDILLRLDATQIRANLAIITKGLDELAARQAREEAEQNGLAEVVFPPELLARKNDSDVARQISGEQALFEMRGAAREGRKAQLRERIDQLKVEIEGLTAQETAKGREIELIHEELEGVRELFSKNLIQFGRVTALERDAARLEGERGQLVAAIAQTRGKIAETELQVLQVDHDMQAEVGRDLADIRAKYFELVERRAAAEDQLKRIEIRAPQRGRVHQLAVHTLGGVISAGEPVMQIVPVTDSLVIEANVQPGDIDQLFVGQPASVHFTAFNRRTTPDVFGEVSRISPNVTTDPTLGGSYYTIRISVPPQEIRRLGDVTLIPGMPVETFIETTPRTMLSYLTKPFSDQLQKAFRDS